METLRNMTGNETFDMFGYDNYSDSYPDVGGTVVVEPPLYIVMTSTMLYIIIFLVGVIGNLLVILVIVYGRSMRTSVNMYLANLCVADILVIIVCMPTALADIFTKEIWYFGEFMCKSKFLPFSTLTISLFFRFHNKFNVSKFSSWFRHGTTS